MSDKKISQLPTSSVPLSGTEVLPIVQSGATKQVSVNNLTAGKPVSADSLKTGSGALAAWHDGAKPVEVGQYSLSLAEQTSGSGLLVWNLYQDSAGAFRYKTNNPGLLLQLNAGGQFSYYTAAAGNAGDPASLTAVASQTANYTLNNGNFVPATAGKGIDFSANTGAAGETSSLLNWYEEGTWTPTDASGAGLTLTYTAAEMRYTRIGRNVFIQGRITYPSTASGATALIGGLPFTSSANNRAGISLGYNNFAANYVPFVSSGSALLEFYVVAGSGAQATNANLSATTFAFSGVYTV